MGINLLAYIFVALAVAMFVVGLLMNYCTHLFPETLCSIFKYGRANTAKDSGVVKYMEVPKSWFGHFYIYAVALQAAVFFSVIKNYSLLDDSSFDSKSWLFLVLEHIAGKDREIIINAEVTILATALFFFHLSRRLYETHYVSIYSDTKMNLLHYFLAFFHYTGSSLSLIAHSSGYATDKRKVNKESLGYQISLYQLIGVILFVYGNYQQYLAHKGLADLRKGKDKTVTTMQHKIPRGGLFEVVSCPNYWTEILIYISLAVVFNLKNTSWNCVTVWVISNQIISGIMNHKWYQEKFGDSYPKSRAAIIPYMW